MGNRAKTSAIGGFVLALFLIWSGLIQFSPKGLNENIGGSHVANTSNSSLDDGMTNENTIDPLMRENVELEDMVLSIVLWNMESGAELPWPFGSSKAEILLGDGCSLDEEGGRLILRFKEGNVRSIVVGVTYPGFVGREVQFQIPRTQEPSSLFRISLDPKLSVSFDVIGEEEIFQYPCEVVLQEGFVEQRQPVLRLDSSRRFSAEVNLGVKGQPFVIEFRSEKFGRTQWVIDREMIQRSPVQLKLPPLATFDLEFRSSLGSTSDFEIFWDSPFGLSLSVLTGTVPLQQPRRLALFSGDYSVAASQLNGRHASRKFNFEEFGVGEIPLLIVDFDKQGTAHFNQPASAPPLARIPSGTFQFKIHLPAASTTDPVPCDIKLWQFTSDDKRRNMCSIEEYSGFIRNGEVAKAKFFGRAVRRGEKVRYGLEVFLSGYKQCGLALVEGLDTDQILDFGQIEVQVPGELAMSVVGLGGLSQYSIALAPSSQFGVSDTALSGFLGDFDSSNGEFFFSGIVPGAYQVGAFRDGLLAASTEIFVYPFGDDEAQRLTTSFLAPGELTLVPDRNGAIQKYEIGTTGRTFWPLRSEIQYVGSGNPMKFHLPADYDLFISAHAPLVDGELSVLFYVPVQLKPGEKFKLDMQNPPGGVIEGVVSVPVGEFLSVRSANSNRRFYGLLDSNGRFRLTGFEEGSFDLYLMDSEFEMHPIEGFNLQLSRGTLDVDGTIIPEH